MLPTRLSALPPNMYRAHTHNRLWAHARLHPILPPYSRSYLTDAFEALLREQSLHAGCSLRTAGYLVALRRLQQADSVRGHS